MRKLLLLLPFVLCSLVPWYQPAPAILPVKGITPEEITAQFKEETEIKITQELAKQAESVFRVHHAVLHPHHAELVAKYARKHHIPVRLLAALIYVESSGKTNAVSRCGAVGLMQINIRVWHYTKAEMMDPEKNIEVGTHILGTYVYQRGWKEGLHAYNGLRDPTDRYAESVYRAAGMKIPS